jgi:hypothetical protein
MLLMFQSILSSQPSDRQDLHKQQIQEWQLGTEHIGVVSIRVWLFRGVVLRGFMTALHLAKCAVLAPLRLAYATGARGLAGFRGSPCRMSIFPLREGVTVPAHGAVAFRAERWGINRCVKRLGITSRASVTNGSPPRPSADNLLAGSYIAVC